MASTPTNFPSARAATKASAIHPAVASEPSGRLAPVITNRTM